MSAPLLAGEALPFACHACPRSFPTLAALRVHAVVDERRVLTPAEKTGSAQLSLLLHAIPPTNQEGS